MNRGDARPSAKTETSYSSGTTSSAKLPAPMSTLTPIARWTTGRPTTTTASAISDAMIANRPRLRIRLTRLPFVWPVIVPAED